MDTKVSNVRRKIDEIRCISARELPAHQRRDRVTETIVNDLRSKGTFFNTPQGLFYFLEGGDPRLFRLGGDSSDLRAFIVEEYGINRAERQEYEHLLAGLHNEAHTHGKVVDVHRLAHYERDSNRLYVSRFDGQVYKLDGRQIRLYPNGKDGVFFWDEPKWKPYELLRDERPHGLFASLVEHSANFASAGNLTADEQEWLFSLWIRSLFFASVHPTKPLLLKCGEKGSGKTLALRKLLRMLFGPAGEVRALERSKPDGFIAAVTSDPIAVFDNVDEAVGWLPDHLAQVATGIGISRRQLYTTNEVVEFRPQCSIALTSRTPKFLNGRDDVLDRTIVLETERRLRFQSEDTLLRGIAKSRDLLWTELLRDLNRIVRQWPRMVASADPSDFRMADFAVFARWVAAARRESPNKPDGIFAKLDGQRAGMLLSTEPIRLCLEHWLADPNNCGRAIRSAELRKELANIAEREKLPWPYGTPSSLAQRLRHIKSNLSKEFEIDVQHDSAKQVSYRFHPKAEALSQLECRLLQSQAA